MRETFEKALRLFYACDFRGYLETINPLMKYFMTNQMIIMVAISLVALKDREVLDPFLRMHSNSNDDAVDYFIRILSTPLEAKPAEDADEQYPLHCLAIGTRLMYQGDFSCAKSYLALCIENDGFENDMAATLIKHLEMNQDNGYK